MEEVPLSLLEILASQRVGNGAGDEGIRLFLHPSLLERLNLTSYPFAFCAATGNVSMALHIYRHGSWYHDVEMPVASLFSLGINGDTPWQKPLMASASDIARLAGHSRMALMLDKMQARVPLKWARDVHHKFPQQFRDRARDLVNTLSTSGWFVVLPGPARTLIVDTCMQRMSRNLVWGMIKPDEWQAAVRGEFGKDLEMQLAELLRSVGAISTPVCSSRQTFSSAHDEQAAEQHQAAAHAHPQLDDLDLAEHDPHVVEAELGVAEQVAVPLGLLRQFQFKISYNRRTHEKHSWGSMLLRGVLSVAVCALAVKCKRERRALAMAYLAGTCAGAGYGMPGLSLLLGQLLGGL